MIVVLTPEHHIRDEVFWVNRLLDGGVDVLHVRKPHAPPTAVFRYIRSIGKDYLDRVALHYHHGIAEDLGITRLHFSEKERRADQHRPFIGKYTLSTSVHRLADFDQLGKAWSYAFLSPAFPSISKPGYGVDDALVDRFGQRRNRDVKLIALGGVHQGNMARALSAGADGVALNGAVWRHPNPLKIVTLCKQRDPSY